jgi:inorganic pyrophosphatase
MTVTSVLRYAGKFEIQTYERPDRKVEELKKTHVPFSGTPLRHPLDEDKIILVADPYSTNTFYYEFMTDDVDYAEKLPSLTDSTGRVVSVVRLWVKRGTTGLQCIPFVVEHVAG